MNGVTVLFTNFGFSIKKILAIIIVTLLLILMFPILAISSLGLPAMSFLANAPSAKAAEERGVIPGNTYAWGNCTWWAYAMRRWANSPIPNTWGNANTWDDNAKRDGYIVNDTPAAGAVFQTDEGPYGHVAYVIEVNQINGDWKISEMNARGLNIVSQRTFSKEAAKSYKFIHNKPGAQPWNPQPITSPPPYGLGR